MEGLIKGIIEFREKTKLYKIPVSSASIVVNEARKRNIKKFNYLL